MCASAAVLDMYSTHAKSIFGFNPVCLTHSPKRLFESGNAETRFSGVNFEGPLCLYGMDLSEAMYGLFLGPVLSLKARAAKNTPCVTPVTHKYDQYWRMKNSSGTSCIAIK